MMPHGIQTMCYCLNFLWELVHSYWQLFEDKNLYGIIVTIHIYKSENIQKVQRQQIHIHTYDLYKQTNTVWGKLDKPGMTGVCSDFHSGYLKFWRRLSMLSKLITLQNLKDLELDLDTLHGTCWVKPFIKAMGIDFDISIFLMSPQFGYLWSSEMNLIRTDAKKIIKKTKLTFIGLSPSFSQHPFSGASSHLPGSPKTLWCQRVSINAGPSSLKMFSVPVQQNFPIECGHHSALTWWCYDLHHPF